MAGFGQSGAWNDPATSTPAISHRATRLNHIADRYDAGQLSPLDHRKMAELTLGHAPHQIDNLVLPAADRDFAFHHLGDRRFEGSATHRAHCTDDVTFGDDADRLAFIVHHYQYRGGPVI